MSWAIKVAPTAARQIRSASQWWNQNRPKAPSAFHEELAAAYGLIRELPNAGESVTHPTITGLRRILLGRIRYHLYYRVESGGGTVEVLALWHTSREGDSAT